MSDAPAPPSSVWAPTPAKIQEAVRRIVEVAQPLKVILFGSQARGQTRGDSDVDLLVIQQDSQDPPGEAARLHACLRGLPIAVDIVVVTRAKFEYWKDTPGNVYYEAAQDGKALYEAA